MNQSSFIENSNKKDEERLETMSKEHQIDEDEDEKVYYRNKGLNTPRRSPSERVQSVKSNKNSAGSGLFFIEKRDKLNASVNSAYEHNEDDENESNKLKPNKSNVIISKIFEEFECYFY
jgi:hypothetical protein